MAALLSLIAAFELLFNPSAFALNTNPYRRGFLSNFTYSIPGSSNLAATCTNCKIITDIAQTLTYSIPLETSTITRTVIPYSTVHPNGSVEVNYSTQISNSTGNSSTLLYYDSKSPITWSTLGTILTWPTSYILFLPSELQAETGARTANSPRLGGCPMTTVPFMLPQEQSDPQWSHFIFPSTSAIETLPLELLSYLQTQPAIQQVLVDFSLTNCQSETETPEFKSSGIVNSLLSVCTSNCPQPDIKTTAAYVTYKTGAPNIITLPADPNSPSAARPTVSKIVPGSTHPNQQPPETGYPTERPITNTKPKPTGDQPSPANTIPSNATPGNNPENTPEDTSKTQNAGLTHPTADHQHGQTPSETDGTPNTHEYTQPAFTSELHPAAHPYTFSIGNTHMAVSPIPTSEGGGFAIGTRTYRPDNTGNVGTHEVFIPPSASIIILDGTKTLVYPTEPTSSGDGVVLGGSTYTPRIVDGTTEYEISQGQTLIPEGSPIVLDGTTYSLPRTGSLLYVNGQASQIHPQDPSTPTDLVLTINGNAYTASNNGGVTNFIIGPSRTLTPGGEVTISGTTYSLPISGSAFYVNGQASTIYPHTTSITAAPALTISGSTYFASVSSGTMLYVIGSRTLTAGGEATILGITYSLPSGGSALIVNSHTSTIPPASITSPPTLTINGHTFTPTASGSSTWYVVGGETLTPGGVVTIDGTRVSLDPEESVLVFGPQTRTSLPSSASATTTTSTSIRTSSKTIGIGDYVASGIGETHRASSASRAGAGKLPRASSFLRFIVALAWWMERFI